MTGLALWLRAQGSMGVSLAAAAALEPQKSQEQLPAEVTGRKQPLKSCNAAEAAVASPNSLLFLPNKNKVMPCSSGFSCTYVAILGIAVFRFCHGRCNCC